VKGGGITMNKFGFLLTFSGLFILFFVGCGPSEEEIATMIAVALTHATEPTLTPLPTSTYTPTPTSTNTPPPTLSPTKILPPTSEPYNLEFACDGNLDPECENIFPSDTLIAFSSENRNQLEQSTHYDIWTMDPNYPTILHQLTNTTEDDLMSVWSPDGERIVFARYAPFRIGHNEDASLWVINRNGPIGSETMILDWWYVGGGGIQPYFWYTADDGDRIYYMKDPGGRCNFYWIYANGEPDQPENLVIGGESICQADLSPYGNSLVFNYYGNAEFFTADFIVDKDTTRVENIAPFLSNFDIVAHPHWSPDGNQIAFGRFYGQYVDVYLSNVDNQQSPKKITLSTNTWQNSWSPDSNWIVSKEFSGITFYSVNNNSILISLTDDGIMDQYPDWSP
jgi:dipeptidyl aminopeptidase/acylaminoacyl peptidase